MLDAMLINTFAADAANALAVMLCYESASLGPDPFRALSLKRFNADAASKWAERESEAAEAWALVCGAQPDRHAAYTAVATQLEALAVDFGAALAERSRAQVADIRAGLGAPVPPFTCECEAPERKLYTVTGHDGKKTVCAYCDGCAELAARDWNGETAAIEPLKVGDNG